LDVVIVLKPAILVGPSKACIMQQLSSHLELGYTHS